MQRLISFASNRRMAICTLGLALLFCSGGLLHAQATATPPQQGTASAGENTTPVNTVPEKK